MTERRFKTQVIQHVRHLFPEAWVWPWPDAIWVPGTRFIPTKPFDISIQMGGIHYGLELKVWGKKTAWPFTAVKESQIGTLLDLEVNGGKGFIVLRIALSQKVALVKALRIGVFCNLKDIYEQQRRRKSFPLADILNDWIDIPKEKVEGKWIWDFRKIIREGG